MSRLAGLFLGLFVLVGLSPVTRLSALDSSTPTATPTASTSVGIVILIDGTAETQVGEAWVALEEGDRVPVSSRVRTGKASLCELQFAQVGIVRLSSSTVVDLKTLRLDGTKKAVDLKVVSGQILAKVNKLTGDERFTVQTATANCGVRGTEFLVGADESDNLDIAVSEGEVVLLAPTFEPSQWDDVLASDDTAEEARSLLADLYKSATSVRSGNELRVAPKALQAQADVMRRVQEGLGPAARQGREALRKVGEDLRKAPPPGPGMQPRPLGATMKASFQGPRPLQVQQNLPPPPPLRPGSNNGRDQDGQLLPPGPRQPGQPGQAPQPGAPGEPAQPNQPGQPAQPGKAPQPAQPVQPSQPNQPGKAGQPNQPQTGGTNPPKPGTNPSPAPAPQPKPAPRP